MSFILMAPHELVQMVSLLPSPEFGDSDNIVGSFNLKRSMNNTIYTYLKTSSEEVLTYEFILTRGKTLEVIAFIRTYYAYNVRIINHKGETYVGKIMNDPSDITHIQFKEVCMFRLEFRGKKL